MEPLGLGETLEQWHEAVETLARIWNVDRLTAWAIYEAIVDRRK